MAEVAEASVVLAGDEFTPIDWGNCSECGTKIETMCFFGTGVCCILCLKKRDGDPPKKTY